MQVDNISQPYEIEDFYPTVLREADAKSSRIFTKLAYILAHILRWRIRLQKMFSFSASADGKSGHVRILCHDDYVKCEIPIFNYLHGILS